MHDAFTEEQKEYLAGFAVGAGLASAEPASPGDGSLPDSAAATATYEGPDRLLYEAQDLATAGGKALVREESSKRERHPLDRWPEIMDHSRRGAFPKGIDVFHWKAYGLFHVAPAQDGFMCRLRLPGGMLTSHQLAGVADIAEDLAGGYAHVTTRANLQLREIAATAPPKLLARLADLGIVTRGAGADNIRNVTCTPTAGFDPQEWWDTSELAREMHDHILNDRRMYHLPRKFNIAFDGGGVLSCLADTNDIGFAVVRVAEEAASPEAPAGTYFRVLLGGITGHGQFASDTGWLVEPDRCVEVAAAIVRVFIRHGDRTDRKKARLKYLIDAWGVERFLAEVVKELPAPPVEWPVERCERPAPPTQAAHLGFHPQADPDRVYLGVVLPVGYMTPDDMRLLSRVAQEYGSGRLRLTCWQNVLIPDVPRDRADALAAELGAGGIEVRPHSIRAGLVACTGNAGCKFAASDTKRHAIDIAERVEGRFGEVDLPINIHVTGCPHSCAQHYIGDIGLVGAKVEQAAENGGGEDDAVEVEGYHLFVGGGADSNQGIARELLRDVPASEAPLVVENLLRSYLQQRESDESFVEFVRRHDAGALRSMIGGGVTVA